MYGATLIRFILVILLLGAVAVARSASMGRAQPTHPRLRIAFSSFRDRPLHPRVYFYETNGQGGGKVTGGIEAVNLRSDTRPTLTADGTTCAFASEQENVHSETRLWDVAAAKEIPAPPGLNTEVPEIGGFLSSDGSWIAFSARNRPGVAAGWSLLLYDRKAGKTLETPGLNSDEDDHSPALSADGRWLGFVSNRGDGRSRIYLYDREKQALADLPGLASRSGRDGEPSLSGDGRFLAFSSDRPGGAGSRDLYLYDRQAATLVPLPGLNAVGPEQSPALTPDARYLAFVAERASGQGERDILLYDRVASRLVPLPGLNSKAEDFDPGVFALP